MIQKKIKFSELHEISGVFIVFINLHSVCRTHIRKVKFKRHDEHICVIYSQELYFQVWDEYTTGIVKYMKPDGKCKRIIVPLLGIFHIGYYIFIRCQPIC